MSLSTPLPVNSAAIPVVASGDAAPVAAPVVTMGALPEGGASVFDILLQQIAAEIPVQAEAVTAPVARADLAAAVVTNDLNVAAPEEDLPEADTSAAESSEAATIAAQMAMVAAPAVQPQTRTAEAAPELSQADLAVDPRASNGEPEKTFPLRTPAGKGKDAGEGDAPDAPDAQDTIDEIAKTSAEPLRAAAKADPRPVLAKVRDALTGPDPQPAQASADPRVVSAAAPDAQSSNQPQAFSLQAISDTQGSYSATGASTTAGSNMSRAAVETLSALSMQISKKLEHGSTKFAIELYPADLGKVEVSLHIGRDGKTTAHLTFDSPVTAASFGASEPELRQQLADAGVSVDKDGLSFSSRDSSSQGGNSFGSALAQDQQQQSQARHASRALDAARKVADDSDLNAALNTAMQAMRTGASTLALNLIV